MQVSRSFQLQDGRGHTMIGRIKAASSWRASSMRGDADKDAALKALIEAAEDYDADAIIGLDFEIDGLAGPDVEGVQLQRVAATGIAVKFSS
jgi:uncharacterized protein YbjQ (UPF0145 family)